MSAADSQIDVVLFDVGGVLLTNGWDHVERATVLAKFNLDKAEFEARHPEPYDAWERDATNADTYLDATVFYTPRSFSKEEFIAAMKEESKPIPDTAMGIFQEIAASDSCMIGLLNNESRLLHEYRMRAFQLQPLLDVQLSSCYLGLRKPEPAIYRRALDILGCPPERIVFIDDRQNNADAAAAFGMHAIRFLGEAQLRHDLTQFHIL